MARNYEKNFSRLNRLWLQNGVVKKEKRPKLSALKTADEISYWLPSIKSELDFSLKQMEVPCYTDNKIEECRKHVMYLEAEYKAFVRKIHQVKLNIKTTPWTSRPYEAKNSGHRGILALQPMEEGSPLSSINLLDTPVLMHDHLYEEECDVEPQPIDASDITMYPYNSNFDSIAENPLYCQPHSIEGRTQARMGDVSSHESTLTVTPSFHKVTNILGLDYSSSEEEA